MASLTPQVLALDYYDGATEGFLNKIGDERIYFFKVAAWDQNQNKRLYLLGQVAPEMYLELLDILTKTHQTQTSQTWVPTWMFGNSELESRANRIVEICKLSLKSPTFLALAENLEGEIEVVRPNAKGLVSAIAMANETCPGNLEGWIAQSL